MQNKEESHHVNDSSIKILHDKEKNPEMEIGEEEDANQQYFMNICNEDLGLLARQESNFGKSELEIIIDKKKPEIQPFETAEKVPQLNPTIVISDDEKNLLLNKNIEPAKDEIEEFKNESEKDKNGEDILNIEASPQNDLTSSPFFPISPNNQSGSNSMFSPISQNAPTLPPTPANAGMKMSSRQSKTLIEKIRKSKFKFRKEEKLEKVA